MKKLILRPQPPFAYKLDIEVFDQPDPAGDARKRCTITCDFYRGDIEKLQGRGLDLAGALDYYKDDIYSKVRYLISQDAEFESGLDESLALIESKISKYFE